MAKEWCEYRCGFQFTHIREMVLLDGQGCEKVIACGISPSPANQTEGSERFLVVLDVIDNGLDKVPEEGACKHS